MLVYDEYSSQYNDEIVEKSIEIYIILLLLLDNDNNLIQPLGISVFNTFKMILKLTMDKFIIDKACTAFSENYS